VGSLDVGLGESAVDSSSYITRALDELQLMLKSIISAFGQYL